MIFLIKFFKAYYNEILDLYFNIISIKVFDLKKY